MVFGPGRDGGGRGGEPRGVVIYCGGNGELYEQNQLWRQLRDADRTVILWNYPGYGQSHGTASRDGMILGCSAAVSFAVHQLGFPPSAVTLLGHSIGGGVSAETAAHFPEVNIIADRTFSQLTKAANSMAQRILHIQDESRAYWLRWAVWGLLVVGGGWQLDTARSWARLCKAEQSSRHRLRQAATDSSHRALVTHRPIEGHGLRMICYAEQDEVIGAGAQLQEVVLVPPPAAERVRALRPTALHLEERWPNRHNRGFMAPEWESIVAFLDETLMDREQ